MMKPNWRPRTTKTLTTRVVGIRGPNSFHNLIKKLIADNDIEENNGKATFVPADMQYDGQKKFEPYGRMITIQQSIIRDNNHITLTGITRWEMDQIKPDLLKVPGIKEINGTRQTYRQGKWNLRTTPKIAQTSLETIDHIIRCNKQIEIIQITGKGCAILITHNGKNNV